MCCVSRQLSALLVLETGIVCNEMRELEQKQYGMNSWSDNRCTPKMVIEFCKVGNLGVCIMHDGNVVETLAGPTLIVAAPA